MYNENQSYFTQQAHREARELKALDFTPSQQAIAWISAFTFYAGLLLISF